MVYRFIETILGECDYYKKVIKKHFNKNLVISEKDNKYFSQVISAGYVINYLI